MIELRSAEARGRTDWGWLDSRHTFSFGEYHDPAHMGFRTLRVINDDRVKPGAAFGRHGHRDMEILSYVLEGVLEHQDSSGGGGVIRLKPAYGQQAFDRDMASRVFVLLASKEGRDGSLQIHQDVDLWVASIGGGERRELRLRPSRHAWIHVARGSVSMNGTEFDEGDGAAVSGEDRLAFIGQQAAEVLVFDLA
ncbi:MAG: quercetin 2,3-dioxygenase [Candidatus Rokuibacteriota bacterium]|nr:MAG: quercetin 2,3-dioxygenase [Candidatus Rokubacteria bacterium]